MTIERFSGRVSAADVRRLTPDPPTAVVAGIIERVREQGDQAVLEVERQFAPASADPSTRPLAPDRLAAALDALDDDLRRALVTAIDNVRAVSRRQIPEPYEVSLPQGHYVRSLPTSVKAAAAYVPGGRGSYPSTAIMCLVPAIEAGVDRIALTSPVREDGEIDSTVAAVCALLGVREVYALGGAQAIAALALGTETIEPVDVIVGPGNAFVQEAKRQLYGVVGVDGVAGPSELAIVADRSANPRHLALDLLAQAEHGPDSLVALISDDSDLLDAVEILLGTIDAPVALVHSESLDDAVELADELAPEHMQIACDEPAAEELAARIRRAGCLFVGHNGATAFGDYVAGSNHVLPTGTAARFTSALNVGDFMRRVSIVEIPDAAVPGLAKAGAIIADAEGFTAHAASMRERVSDGAHDDGIEDD